MFEAQKDAKMHMQYDHLGAFGLAPMEGITDFATRLWFAKTSQPKFCWTPFHRATVGSNGKLPKEYIPELDSLKSYLPYKLIPQIMTGNAEHFCVVAETVLKFADYVDLNCGCPSPVVVGRGSGSSVLEHVDKFSDLVGKICSNIGEEKLSVKMRIGFNDPAEMTELVKSIGHYKLRHLTIHARTRPQKYTGKADWRKIYDAAALTSIPIVGSGDIFTSAIFVESLGAAPDVKIRIIGRGAVRNPWIFSEISSGKNKRLTLGALLYALASFAWLQELHKSQFDALCNLVKDGLFLSPCGEDETLWREFFSTITEGKNINELILSSYAFARLKMLWNHFRTSLPEKFWRAEPLKCRSFSEFISCIKSFSGEDELILNHYPEWNWLFSGEKRIP